tara:strand:+ start:311 stop:694 length:384 start_codon:yes stop_codon:yes gene_type:complete
MKTTETFGSNKSNTSDACILQASKKNQAGACWVYPADSAERIKKQTNASAVGQAIWHTPSELRQIFEMAKQEGVTEAVESSWQNVFAGLREYDPRTEALIIASDENGEMQAKVSGLGAASFTSLGFA